MTTPPPDDRSSVQPSWPTVRAGAPGAPVRASFAAAPSPRPTDRIRRHLLFGLLALGLLLASGVLVLVVFLLRPPPPRHCPALFKCGGPIARGAVRNGTIYKSREFGFKVEYGPNSGIQTSPAGIVTTYTGHGSEEKGQVEIIGLTTDGATAWDVVSSVAQQITPGAVEEYEVPNPYVGGVPAVGEAYDVEQDGSSDSSGVDRLIILAAVRGDLTIVVVDMGPYWTFSSSNTTVMKLNDHPSPADQFAALFADPEVNSVAWPPNSG